MCISQRFRRLQIAHSSTGFAPHLTQGLSSRGSRGVSKIRSGCDMWLILELEFVGLKIAILYLSQFALLHHVTWIYIRFGLAWLCHRLLYCEDLHCCLRRVRCTSTPPPACDHALRRGFSPSRDIKTTRLDFIRGATSWQTHGVDIPISKSWPKHVSRAAWTSRVNYTNRKAKNNSAINLTLLQLM